MACFGPIPPGVIGSAVAAPWMTRTESAFWTVAGMLKAARKNQALMARQTQPRPCRSAT